METTIESLQMIFYVRSVLFQMYDRENEYAFYLMKLAKLYRKQNQDVIIVNKFFIECKKYEHKICDFEYEYTKYILQIKNAHEAYQYLHSKLETIKAKVDQMQKQIGVQWMPKMVYQKAQLLELELLIKIDPRNEKIFENFTDFVKKIEQQKLDWEKPNFLFAQYIDTLERNLLTETNGKESDKQK